MQEIINWWYGTMEAKYMHYMAHFFGGFTLATIVAHYYGNTKGLIVGVTAGILKEIIDKLTGRGTPELLAALITAFGALLAYYI